VNACGELVDEAVRDVETESGPVLRGVIRIAKKLAELHGSTNAKICSDHDRVVRARRRTREDDRRECNAADAHHQYL
jgi:hypothetical protein